MALKDGERVVELKWMGLRDLFAGMALQGLMSHGVLSSALVQHRNDFAVAHSEIAEECYALADALLRQREKEA